MTASPSAHSGDSSWTGYKFEVGDNIDKNIKPRYERHEIRGKSLHHFHGYAVKDRLDLSKFSNIPPPPPSPDARDFLLTLSDISQLKEEFSVLISR